MQSADFLSEDFSGDFVESYFESLGNGMAADKALQVDTEIVMSMTQSSAWTT